MGTSKTGLTTYNGNVDLQQYRVINSGAPVDPYDLVTKEHVDFKSPTSVMEFGAAGDGVSNDSAALNLAIESASYENTIHFPAGRYLFAGNLNFTGQHISFDPGAVLVFDTNATMTLNNTTISAGKWQIFDVDTGATGCGFTACGSQQFLFEWFGGHADELTTIEANCTDNKPAMDLLISLVGVDAFNKPSLWAEVVFSGTIYRFSPTDITVWLAFKSANSGSYQYQSRSGHTSIGSFAPAQSYIWKFGPAQSCDDDTNDPDASLTDEGATYAPAHIDGLSFTSRFPGVNTAITDSAVVLVSCAGSVLRDVLFHQIDGRALRIRQNWETQFIRCRFLEVGYDDGEVILYGTPAKVGATQPEKYSSNHNVWTEPHFEVVAGCIFRGLDTHYAFLHEWHGMQVELYARWLPSGVASDRSDAHEVAMFDWGYLSHSQWEGVRLTGIGTDYKYTQYTANDDENLNWDMYPVLWKIVRGTENVVSGVIFSRGSWQGITIAQLGWDPASPPTTESTAENQWKKTVLYDAQLRFNDLVVDKNLSLWETAVTGDTLSTDPGVQVTTRKCILNYSTSPQDFSGIKWNGGGQHGLNRNFQPWRNLPDVWMPAAAVLQGLGTNQVAEIYASGLYAYHLFWPDANSISREKCALRTENNIDGGWIPANMFYDLPTFTLYVRGRQADLTLTGAAQPATVKIEWRMYTDGSTYQVLGTTTFTSTTFEVQSITVTDTYTAASYGGKMLLIRPYGSVVIDALKIVF